VPYEPKPSSRTPDQQQAFIAENASVIDLMVGSSVGHYLGEPRYPRHLNWFLSLEEHEVQEMRDAYVKTVSKHKQLTVSWPSFVLTCAGIALKLHDSEDKHNVRKAKAEQRHLDKLERRGRQELE
jgi:hypothetical protein